MGKNIAIIILIGFIGFFGYYVFNVNKSPEELNGRIVRRVKQKVPVLIYSTIRCTYCNIAKKFMEKKGIQFENRDVDILDNAQEMIRRTKGARGVPQFFINNKHIGGLKELQTLERQGKLDQMLSGQDVSLSK